jgi:hypothetical protein
MLNEISFTEGTENWLLSLAPLDTDLECHVTQDAH